MTSTVNQLPKASVINSSNKNYKIIDWPAEDAIGGWVEIIINDVVHTATVKANGTYSYELPDGWSDGKHAIQIIKVDAAGSRGAPALIIINIDTVAPSAPKIMRVIDNSGDDHYLTPGDEIKDKTPQLSGSAEPGSVVTIYNGATILGSVTADRLGVWEYEATLAKGTHNITVTAKDVTGNTSSASSAFVIKVTDTVTVLSNEEGADSVAGQANAQDFITPDVAAGGTKVTPTQNNILRFTDIDAGGAKEAGNLMQIIVDGSVYSTIVNPEGKWSWTSPELADGLHVVQFRGLDKAGNWGPATQIIYDVDSASPEKPIIMSVLDDVGGSHNLSPGEYTNDNMPTLSGIAQPDMIVKFYDGGAVLIGSVKAASDGTWTFTPAVGLSEGTHFISAEYVDGHGRTSPKSDSFKLIIDTNTPVTPTLDYVEDDEGREIGEIKSGVPTDDKTPTFSGTAQFGSVVQIWNGTALLGTATVSALGKWEFTPSPALADGSYDIKVSAISQGGNESAKSSGFDLIIDSTLAQPVEIGDVFADNVAGVTTLIPDNGVTNDSTPVVTGVGNNGDVVYLYVDGKPGAVGSTTVAGGKWSITPTPALTEGEHQLTVRAYDPTTGKWAPISQPRDIEIDLTAPEKPEPAVVIDDQGTITGVLPPGGSTDDKRPEFKGSDVEEGDTVEVIVKDDKGNPIFIGTQIVGADGEWSITPPTDLGDGEYEVVVGVTDPAGNKSDKSDPIKIIIDTTKPDALKNVELIDDVGIITGLITNGMSTDDTKPTFSGVGVDGTKVAIVIDGTEVARVNVTGGTWTYTPATALAEGPHVISAKPYSASGVPGDATTPINFIVDTTAPLSGTFDGVWCDEGQYGPLPKEKLIGDQTNDDTLIMRGTGVNGDTVLIYGSDGKGELLGSTTVVGGKWEYVTDKLAEKLYKFHVIVQDAAGNQLDVSTVISTTVDVTEPTKPVIPGISSIFELNELSEGEVSNLMSMSLNDILAQGEGNMFIENGKSQLLVNGKEGDVLNIADILPEGAETASWQQAAGTVTVAGVQYNVYENTASNAELLIQQGIETHH